jgi:uncharacterized repeat protein (TIGR03803 family)
MIMLKLSHGGSTATKTQRPIMVSALLLRSGGYSSNLAVKPIPRVRRMGGFISSRIADIITTIALSCTAAFLSNRDSSSAKRCASSLFAARTPLLRGHDGAFYSTTEAGGTGNCALPGIPTGCGTVFRVTSAGEETVIHDFAGYPIDGSGPVGGLVQAKDDTFFGTTEQGGFTIPGNCSSGCGTIFSVAPTGTEQIIYACGEPPNPWYYDCRVPSGTLLLGAADTLTGTSQNGGGGWGNVFSIAPITAVTLTATPATITLHKSTDLKWSSTHAQSCEASGSWSGSKTIKGGHSETPAGTGSFIYTLTCTGIGGTASASATVTVTL